MKSVQTFLLEMNVPLVLEENIQLLLGVTSFFISFLYKVLNILNC